MAQRAGGRSSTVRQGRTAWGGASAGPSFRVAPEGAAYLPFRGDGAALALASRVARNGLFQPEQGRSCVGHGGSSRMAFAGRGVPNTGCALPWRMFLQSFLIPAGGNGVGRAQNLCAWARRRAQVRRAHALGGTASCPCPKGGRRGYQSRKGRFLGVPALEGSERAVGAGLFRHVGGRFGVQPEAGPCRYGDGSRRPRDSVAGRADGFAPRNMAGGGGTPALRLALGWAGLGRDCVPRGRAAKRGWAEKPFRASPPGDIRRRRAWRGSWGRCTGRPCTRACCRRPLRR